VVGERSYGKGTVQNVIYLERKKSAMRLTTARYLRPSGRNIDRRVAEKRALAEWGVEPNEGAAVQLSEEQVFELFRQRNLRDLEGLKSPQQAVRPSPDDGAGQTEVNESLPPALPASDPILQRARELLEPQGQGKIAA
jgi:carboxyl-terminal processing protease